MRRLPFLLVLALLASIPLEDSLQFHVGRVSKVLGILAFGTWVLASLVQGQVRRPTRGLLLAAAFVGWACLSYFWAATPDDSLGKISTLLQALMLLALVWGQLDRRRDLLAGMRAFLVGATGAALLTVQAAQAGLAVQGTSRFASANAGPNNTGCLLVVAVTVAWYVQRADLDRRWRWFARALVPLGVLAVLLTASRSALIALAAATAALLLTRANLRPRRLATLVVAAGAIGLLALHYVPAGSIQRLSTTDREISGGTLNGRTTYWHTALELFADHPVQGIGTDMFEAEADPNHTGEQVVAHNAFLSILAELGLVGLGLFVAALWRAARGVRAALAGTALLRPWMAIGVAWLISACTLTWEVRKVTWLLLAFALAEAHIAARERRELLAGAEVIDLTTAELGWSDEDDAPHAPAF